MGTITKDIFIGFLVGLFATASGFFLYLEYGSKFGFYESLTMVKKGNLIGKVLTLAAIPNLFVFFVFLKKKQDNKAKGVLFATIFTAFLTLILQFL